MRRTLNSVLIGLACASCVGRVQDPTAVTPDPNNPNNPNNPVDPNNPNNPVDPIDPNNPIDPVNCSERGPPITARLRRLTFTQYDRTVSELVGLQVQPSTELGPEVDGITPTLWAGVQTAATDVAGQVIANGNALSGILPCQQSGDGSACAHEFVLAFGKRAYRRPLSTDEIARYDALYTDRAMLTETGTFEEGIELILETFLQSPHLLSRVERSAQAIDGVIKLAGFEVATRLSYALWNGPPDDLLLTAAENGELDNETGVRAQAQRMLTSVDGAPRARALVRESHRDFLGMVGAYGQFWSNTQRDVNLFPEFYPGIDVDFREEVLRFVDHVVFDENGSYASLLTSPTAVVNDKLAPVYGLSGNFSSAWTAVALDPAVRPGILTRAGFVGTHGRVTRGSLIFRGAFVLKRMLCQEIGSPPAGADATPLPDPDASLKTTRQRIQAMTSPTLCASCHHTRINPAGFPFESFDGLGRVRATDNGEPVDTTGTITLDGHDVAYTNAADFSAALALSGTGRACYVQRYADFSFQGPVDLGCNRDRIAERLGQPGVTVKDMMIDMVASPAFLNRSSQEAP